MFDSGYYKEITIKDIDNKLLFAKTRPLIVDKVPQWFISLFQSHDMFKQIIIMISGFYHSFHQYVFC